MVIAAVAPSTSDTTMMRVIRCGVGRETFAVDLAQVRGIQHSERIRMGQTDHSLAGFITLRGIGEASVYRLGELLGLSANSNHVAEHILVIDSGTQQPWALLVDRLSQVTNLPISSVQPLPPIVGETFQSCFHGGLLHEDELLLMLAPERMSPEGMALRTGNHFRTTPILPTEFFAASQSLAGERRLMIFTTSETSLGKRPIAFGLPANHVAEILDMRNCVSIPGAPEFVRGAIAWRNHVVPLIDLAQRLGLSPCPEDRRNRIVIARGPDDIGVVGFLVGPTMRMQRLPIPHEPSERELPVEPSLVHHILEFKNETVLMPNLDVALRP